MNDPGDQELEQEAEAILDRLASSEGSVDRGSRVHVVVPQPILGGSPEALDDYLDELFDGLGSAEDLLEQLESLKPSTSGSGTRIRFEAVVPPEALDNLPETLEAMMAQLTIAFDSADRALAALGTPEDELPPVLVEHPQIGFEEQLRKARLALKRLRRYRLHSAHRGKLVGQMRGRERVEDLREIAGFLWALQEAARSFESLGMPKQHIREYLNYLYQMENWEEMEEYVTKFRQAVDSLPDTD